MTSSSSAASTTKASNSSSIDNYVARINKAQKENMDIKCAEFVFECNLPFKVTESEVFKNYSKALNPAYNPPGKRRIGTTLLDKVYNDRFKKLGTFINNANNLSLVTDGWSNIRSDHIVNFVLIQQKPASPSVSFFYKSIVTNGTRQTSQQIFKDIETIIEEVGSDKICAVVTDNCSSMRGAWKLIETKYPNIFANGCAAHVMNLLVKDIFSIRNNMDALDQAKNISKFIKNHQIVLNKFKNLQLAMKNAGLLDRIKALELPVETRWYSNHNTIKSVLLNKNCIQSVFNDRAFNTELKDHGVRGLESVIEYVNDSYFWVKLDAMDILLKPITKVIGEFESDDTNLSCIYQSFVDLRKNIAIKTYVDDRWAFLHTESMGFAYLLNPNKYGGESFEGSDKEDSYTQLIEHVRVNFSVHQDDPHEDTKTFKDQLDTYLSEVSRVNQTASSSTLQIMKNGSPLAYWMIWGAKYSRLQEIAIRVFSTCTSSAASERIWSVFDIVHSKVRNRLGNDKVQKLVFVYANSDRLTNNLDWAQNDNFDIDTELIEID